LRLVIEYESASGWNRFFSGGRLCLDIVDYPGEWLLDLPLAGSGFCRLFAQCHLPRPFFGARRPRRALAREGPAIDPLKPGDETDARELARLYTDYLRACKAMNARLSTLPPGRFLMPGDLDGSPALTFAPLPNLPDTPAPAGSLMAMMQRRFESYKSVVVKPFFREHVARLDRQIVLIDAMQAMNAGREAVIDLERALADVLSCFRPGRGNILTSLVSRRIDKVLIAATKADHLHHESHDRLEAIARRIVERASTPYRLVRRQHRSAGPGGGPGHPRGHREAGRRRPAGHRRRSA
jgi:predicted YcjX-like family ATPase